MTHRIASETLSLTLNPARHTYELKHLPTGTVWRSAPPPAGLTLLSADQAPDRLIAHLADGEGRTFSAVASIPEDAVLRFELMADRPDDPLEDSAIYRYPPAFRAELNDGRMCFCDRSSGVLIGLDDEVYGGRTVEVYGNIQCLDMPWLGVLEGLLGEAMMVYLATPFDALVELAPDDSGRHWPQIQWRPTLKTFGYPRCLELHLLESGGYRGLAKHYREMVREQGRLLTLRDKAQSVPQTANLPGAPIVWGDMDATEFVDIMQAIAGMDRAILANAHANLENKNALPTLNEEGYITTEYDSIGDIFEGETAFQRDDTEKTAYHWEPDAGPAEGWRTLEGDQYYFRSSACALDALKTYVPDRIAEYGFNGRFMDVAGAIGLFEDYHPEHTFDRRQDMRYRREALEYFLKFGMVVGSEHGNDWMVDLTHYYEGSMSGPFWWATDRFQTNGWNAGHLCNPTQRAQIPAEYISHGMGLSHRIPLWDLVYHDCVVGTWYWGDTAGFLYRVAPELADRKDLYNLLHGTIPLLWRDDKRGYKWSDDRERARFLRTYQLTCRFNTYVAFDELVDHRFLTPDGSVQKTTFSSGASALVNFGDEPFDYNEDGETVRLAPQGYRAVADGFDQRRVMVNDTPVTTVMCDGFRFVDLPAEGHGGPFSGKGCASAFRRGDDGWHITTEAGSELTVDIESLTGWTNCALEVRLLNAAAAPVETVCGDGARKINLPAKDQLTTFHVRKRP